MKLLLKEFKHIGHDGNDYHKSGPKHFKWARFIFSVSYSDYIIDGTVSSKSFREKELNGSEHTGSINIIENICGDAPLEDAIFCRAAVSFHFIAEFPT